MTTQARLAAERLAELAGGNRRGTRRLAYDGKNGPRNVRDEQGQLLAAEVCDISQRGIGLVLERRVEPASMLNIELPSKNELGVLKMVARVANVRSQPPGGWYVGCLFLRKLDDVELLALL
jgi:hypothetical protein